VVNNTPDFTGAQYSGLKSGSNPLLDITAYEILDPSAVVDFNLPDPLKWQTTKRVLPTVISNSQLAVLRDGYAYLFGGQVSNKIYQAALNNPADWIDTGATLPKYLANSQLAVIDGYDGYDGYIYLFGGYDGYDGYSTDEIFSAPLSNPLNWKNTGAKLPQALHSSQLAILDGYIYLFGGKSEGGVTNRIFRATTSNPLSWIDTGGTLPASLYNSQLGIDGYDGYICLFGGQLADTTSTPNIYFAPTSSPTSWAVGGALPAAAYGGQFAAVAGMGYLFTCASINPSVTHIFRCDLSKPFQWIKLPDVVPDSVSFSQLAIITDRLFLFGGSGSSDILACNQIIKYLIDYPPAVKYGNVTRTQVAGTTNRLDLYKVLGMKPWLTNY
jgi:hypothetical protein